MNEHIMCVYSNKKIKGAKKKSLLLLLVYWPFFYNHILKLFSD